MNPTLIILSAAALVLFFIVMKQFWKIWKRLRQEEREMDRLGQEEENNFPTYFDEQ